MANKLAIIGYGGMGGWHHKCISQNVPQINITGVYDVRSEAAEKALNSQLEQVTPRVQSQLAARDYTGALTALAALREPVDTFFNDVMVNAEDPALRANRLALLGALHQQMNCVADISRLAA